MTRGEENRAIEEKTKVAEKRARLIAANIIDPLTGLTQYHIVSTKFLNIVIAAILTLLLCGLVILSLVIYLKVNVDQNATRIEQLQEDKKDVNTP